MAPSPGSQHPAAPLAVRQSLTLTPDSGRVIVKLFVPGEDADLVRTRAHALIDRIAGLDADEVERLLDETVAEFEGRHRDLRGTFQHHFELVRHRADRADELSPHHRLLIGAYFTHEYAVEAAALCNPSVVAHPDQSGLGSGQLRVAVSVRQIGEGHLSSIGFVTAVVGPGTELAITERSGPLVAGERADARHRRDLLAAGMADEGWDNEVSAALLGSLPEGFDDVTFENTIAGLPGGLQSLEIALPTIEQLRRLNAAGYATEFPADTVLHQRVLWPSTPMESRGMEDARFVRFVGDDGVPVYLATYTAYDGRDIATRALSTADLRRFQIAPMRGPGAFNKGVALFPRPVGDRRLALCRTDGETIGLTVLGEDARWGSPVPLHGPHRGWELTQTGNCGSPIETDAGWLVLTHGVGTMRRYVISAILLDLHHPERVLAELAHPLLAPARDEREGYVPNVIYTCGALIHDGVLWMPYGTGDARVGFATADLDPLLAAMTPVAAGGS